ncbi:hypothetical protein M5K25_006332 [Dendrobium thyrsiflorum]|uniref:Uncharacterized protein n=1 Tax=Dendrobium thyrsiflorum TaxID=117978 RepID=A0ABD0VAX7_DENTH
MLVIVGIPDKTMKIFVKGADNSMLGDMKNTLNANIIQETESQLKTYSSVGPRILVIGKLKMNRMGFEEWHSSYENSSIVLFRRGSLLKAAVTNIENKNLTKEDRYFPPYNAP